MLTQTTVVAIRALLLLAVEADDRPRTPKQLAQRLDASPTYLGKILGMLVKGGVLDSIRGAHGGVLLARKPDLITLLDVHRATQGPLVPDYCSAEAGQRQICTFHTAMEQIHQQLEGALGRWTIGDLAGRPNGHRGCKMNFEPEKLSRLSARKSP